MNISRALKEWYFNHQRPLPWRETADPYQIWLSEIILQQTRVEQGLPYYIRFISAFPTVKKLAQAPEDQVMKLWQGLGYYSRARNLHATAKYIYETLNGTFPSDYQSIRALNGVGDYTSAAIASFAFNLPYAVVDGNVYRFISRYFGIDIPIDSASGKKIFAELAQDLLDKKLPGIHNQAIMEFGAVQCKPSSPDCSICIFKNECVAFKNDLIKLLPVKTNKLKIRKRYFNYLIVRYKDRIFMNRRGKGDIWQNLYDFPLIETSEVLLPHALPLTDQWKTIFNNQSVHIETISKDVVHKLSHQHIFSRFFEIQLSTKPGKELRSKYIEIQLDDLKNYPVPRLIETIFEERLEGYLSK